jgi:hypothetical protein
MHQASAPGFGRLLTVLCYFFLVDGGQQPGLWAGLVKMLLSVEVSTLRLDFLSRRVHTDPPV